MTAAAATTAVFAAIGEVAKAAKADPAVRLAMLEDVGPRRDVALRQRLAVRLSNIRRRIEDHEYAARTHRAKAEDNPFAYERQMRFAKRADGRAAADRERARMILLDIAAMTDPEVFDLAARIERYLE